MSTTNAARPDDYELQPVKFSRLARRGVLFGLPVSQLVVVGIGAVMLVFSLYVGGGASLIFALPVLVCCSSQTGACGPPSGRLAFFPSTLTKSRMSGSPIGGEDLVLVESL